MFRAHTFPIFPSVVGSYATLSENTEGSMTQFPRLLRTRDAARYCGFAKSTLDKLRCTGGGPQFTRRGKAVYYPIECLDDWLASLPRFENTSEADAAREAEGAT